MSIFMKKKIIISVVAIVVIINVIAGVWLFNGLKLNLDVTNKLTVEIIEQKPVGDEVEVTMIFKNNSESTILSYKVGLIVVSANVIDVQVPENDESLGPKESKEFKFRFSNEILDTDVIDIYDYRIHLEGYIDKISTYSDFGLDANYLVFVEKNKIQ